MPFTASFTDKYSIWVRILHWLMALIIICLIVVGLVMAGMPRSDPNRALLFSLHKSFGLTILLLFFLRITLRFTQPRPPLPDTIPKAERILAEWGHWGFYGFMVAMPVSGYLLSTYYGLPVKWFGLSLPKLVGIDKARASLAGDFHQYAAYMLIGWITMHAGAVLLHYLKHRVNLLKRMI